MEKEIKIERKVIIQEVGGRFEIFIEGEINPIEVYGLLSMHTKLFEENMVKFGWGSEFFKNIIKP